MAVGVWANAIFGRILTRDARAQGAVKMPRAGYVGVSTVIAVSLLAFGAALPRIEAQAKRAPIFEVDPFWPKPLPNHWVTGSTIGLSVDGRDNVWTIHRPNTVEDNFKAADIMVGDARGRDDEAQPGAPAGGTPAAPTPIGACCHVAPPVLVYDQAGALVRSWGGPGAGYDWPDSNHGLTVDHEGNVWLAGNGTRDTQILKFTGSGRFIFQIGTHGVHNGSNDTANFWQPTKLWEDVGAREMYVADGYGNRRVIVLDVATGKYKRHWGAYGVKPSDERMPAYDPKGPPSKQFNTVHCAIVSNDGFVYVCDRVNDRIQVFRKDGTFVKEAFIDTQTFRSGSVWDMTFSRDPQQTYIYAANGVDEKINILLRSTLEVLTSFGDGGRQPGQFFGVHNLATDSKGNLYATETYTGARIQRFLFKGVGPVTKAHQGVVWPARR
jgi:DNA-binding beta-propeller fold protein YncE